MSKMDVFLGKFVEIMIKQSVTIHSENEDGMIQKIKPLVTVGYFIDMDVEYIYLGETEEEITDAVKHTEVVQISLSRERDKYDDVLDGFDTSDELGN